MITLTIRRERSLVLMLLLLMLSGCSMPQTTLEVGVERAASSIPAVTTTAATATPALASPLPDSQASPTAAPVAGTVAPGQGTARAGPPAGWQRIVWQGISIPLPPQAGWETSDASINPTNGLPVIAAGRVNIVPPMPTEPGAIGEYPAPPSFVDLSFRGTLDEWLDLERGNETSTRGNPVEERTVRDMTIAGHPAKAYQRAVTGFGMTEHYALKLDDDRLLWITGDADGISTQIIAGITLPEESEE